MTILFARNIEKSFGDRTLFTLPSLEIQAQDRIGIVGVNGAGKSTLLQILSKEIEADRGIVTHHSSIAIIPQLSEELPETASSLAIFSRIRSPPLIASVTFEILHFPFAREEAVSGSSSLS